MAHDVIKHVGARAYRYRVESFRDPETGRVRARWTYVGRVVDAATSGETRAKRREPTQTRERLVDAFERLVERGPATLVTAGSIATEAGLAHGTFYRHFADKRAVLVAALERVRDAIERAAPSFEPPYGSRATERARVRAWVGALCGPVPERVGLLRAWLEAVEGDPSLQARKIERRRERVAVLQTYLAALAEAGIVTDVRPLPLATALLALVDAMFRESVIATSADPALAEGVVATFDRAIFGTDASAAAASPSTDSTTGSLPVSSVK